MKLAFVSACQSEEIGNILKEAGVPVVIAVNADQEIMDDACKIFSSYFYTNLLLGHTIDESYKQAQTNVRLSKQRFNACCCAHDHDKDCLWFKFYQQNREQAHALHSKECGCNPTLGSREHLPTCGALNEFVDFMRKEKKKALGLDPDAEEGNGKE